MTQTAATQYTTLIQQESPDSYRVTVRHGSDAETLMTWPAARIYRDDITDRWKASVDVGASVFEFAGYWPTPELAIEAAKRVPSAKWPALHPPGGQEGRVPAQFRGAGL